jgi:hypothetical protein
MKFFNQNYSLSDNTMRGRNQAIKGHFANAE